MSQEIWASTEYHPWKSLGMCHHLKPPSICLHSKKRSLCIPLKQLYGCCWGTTNPSWYNLFVHWGMKCSSNAIPTVLGNHLRDPPWCLRGLTSFPLMPCCMLSSTACLGELSSVEVDPLRRKRSIANWSWLYFTSMWYKLSFSYLKQASPEVVPCLRCLDQKPLLCVSRTHVQSATTLSHGRSLAAPCGIFHQLPLCCQMLWHWHAKNHPLGVTSSGSPFGKGNN